MKRRNMLMLLLIACSLTTMGLDAKAADALSLQEAIKTGKAKVAIRGLGGSTGDAIEIIAQRKVPETLRLRLEPGTVFKSDSGSAQNMVGATVKGERAGELMYSPATMIVLTDDAQHRYIVEAYCLDFDKDNPDAGEKFSISPIDQRMAKIISAGQNASASIEAIQSALWLDHEKISPSEIKERLSVTDADIAKGRLLLKQVGETNSSVKTGN